jgi:hypothetical protein
MGIVWVKGSPSAFVDSPRNLVARVEKSIDLDAIVKQAAERMQYIIGTINNTASGPGRVDTTLMIKSVKYRVIIDGGNLVGEFGWLDTQEMYFLYQEKGFTNWLTGREVPAMLALMDAGIEAREQFVRQLRDAIKRK